MAKFTNLTQNFTMIPNWLINNQNVSLKAKGLFIFLASKPNDFNFSAEGLSKLNKEGITSIKNCLKELENTGLLTRKKIKDNNNRFIGIEYILTDNPSNEKTDSGKPTDGKPTDGKPTDINKKDLLKKDLNNKEEYICDFSENQFIDIWKRARIYYDKKPTNIDKLLPTEKMLFKQLLNDGYKKQDFEFAVAGLFFQKTVPAVRVRPEWLLKPENFFKMLDCWKNKSKIYSDDNDKSKSSKPKFQKGDI